MNKEKYTVYKVTNLLNSKIYIGVHKTSDINDSYLGSGSAIKKAVLKYGKESFKKEILFSYKTKKEAYKKEKELVTKSFVQKDTNYNLKEGGVGGSDGSVFQTKESRKKNKDSLKRSYLKKGSYMGSNLHTPEVRKKAHKKLSQVYGKNYLQLNNPLSNSKRESTNILKYGNKHGKINSPEVKKKADESYLKIYDYLGQHLMNPKYIEKRRETKKCNRLKKDLDLLKKCKLVTLEGVSIKEGTLMEIIEYTKIRKSRLVKRLDGTPFNNKSAYSGLYLKTI